jgi:hypothetical protein
MYKKVTVITDPLNPEMDLKEQAYDYGNCVVEIPCSDGFVMLIKLKEEYCPEESIPNNPLD